MIIPNDIRTNVDFVFALRDNIMANKRRLFEYFFGMFSSFSEFNKVFSACTKNFGCLVLDKTGSTASIPDCMRWYVASTSVPAFTLGRPVYFQLSAFIDEIDETYKKKKQLENVATKVIQ